MSDEPRSSRRRALGSWAEAHLGDVLLLIIGVILLVIGLSFWRTNRPMAGGVVTTGRIVAHVTKYDDGGNRWEFPVIEFSDRRERTHRFEAESTGTGAKGTIGRVVEVRYDPDDPSRAQWADQPGRWVWRPVVATGALVLLGDLVWAAWRLLRGRRGAATGDGEAVADLDGPVAGAPG